MKKRIGCLGILLFLVLSIVSCNTNDSPSNNGSENINSSTTISSEEIISSITSEVKINYEVVVKKDNGELINGASVSFYKGDVVSFDGTTNEEGKVIINATSDEYIIKVDGLPRGYRPIKDYKTTLAGDKIEIICNVCPYEDYVPSYYVYHVGDVMYNFDYYDFDENCYFERLGGSDAFPWTFVVDKEGIIYKIYHNQTSYENLKNDIETILKSNTEKN